MYIETFSSCCTHWKFKAWLSVIIISDSTQSWYKIAWSITFIFDCWKAKDCTRAGWYTCLKFDLGINSCELTIDENDKTSEWIIDTLNKAWHVNRGCDITITWWVSKAWFNIEP